MKVLKIGKKIIIRNVAFLFFIINFIMSFCHGVEIEKKLERNIFFRCGKRGLNSKKIKYNQLQQKNWKNYESYKGLCGAIFLPNTLGWFNSRHTEYWGITGNGKDTHLLVK